MPTPGRARLLSVVATLLGLALACSGATHDEVRPGADAWMEGTVPDHETGTEAWDQRCQYTGGIASDDRAPQVYVMVTSADVDCERVTSSTPLAKTLIQVSEAQGARPVLDLSGHEDVRTLFPAGGLLLMGEVGGADRLYLFDPDSLEQTGALATAARYHGTRMSASRRFVAVGDNNQSPVPVHVVDTQDLTVHEVDVAGGLIEAMWLSGRDALAAITEAEDRESDGVRLVLWEVEGGPLALSGEGAPAIDLQMPEHHFQVDLDYTWIGVDPADEVVVFPVEHASRGDELLVLDTVAGEVEVIADAHGPVGFTPEGDTLVAYRYADLDGDGVGDEGGHPALLLVDLETGEQVTAPIPFEGFPEYFVTREGRVVVVASMLGDQELVLYDVDSGTMTEVGGPSLGLSEFVSREGEGELWLIDDFALWRLDFLSVEVEQVDLDFAPAHLNLVSGEDSLVLDEANQTVLRFYDLEHRVVRTTVEVGVD